METLNLYVSALCFAIGITGATTVFLLSRCTPGFQFVAVYIHQHHHHHLHSIDHRPCSKSITDNHSFNHSSVYSSQKPYHYPSDEETEAEKHIEGSCLLNAYKHWIQRVLKIAFWDFPNLVKEDCVFAYYFHVYAKICSLSLRIFFIKFYFYCYLKIIIWYFKSTPISSPLTSLLLTLSPKFPKPEVFLEIQETRRQIKRERDNIRNLLVW